MAETVIDGDEISFGKIYDTIDPKGSFIQKKKWRDIASGLEIPAGDIDDIDSDIKMNRISMKEICIQIFRSWASANDDEATVGRLIEVLDKENLKACANRLRKRFGIEITKSERSSSTLSVTQTSSFNTDAEAAVGDDDNDGDLLKRQNQFIQDNLPGLLDNLTLNCGMQAILTAKGILSTDDVSDLDAIQNDRKKNLYFLQNVLPKKTGYFQILYDAMKEQKQSGATNILSKFN